MKNYRQLTDDEIIDVYNDAWKFLKYGPGERFYIVLMAEKITKENERKQDS